MERKTNIEKYYQDKSVDYGVGGTRKKKIFQLLGPLKDKRILDIGCSTGYIGAEIKKTGNYVVGIDVSEPAILKARAKIDEAYVMNVSGDWLEQVAENKFDVVILAEVLEHVFDPVEVLKKVNDVLLSKGRVIITTPNIMAWHNRLKFVFGIFEYQNQGTFDFGHIRFFTYKYLRRVLSESGFEIEKENHIIFPGKLTRILKFMPQIFANQFVVSAKKLNA